MTEAEDSPVQINGRLETDRQGQGTVDCTHIVGYLASVEDSKVLGLPGK